MSEENKRLAEKEYKLGGMKNTDSSQEVSWVMQQIDGVEKAEVFENNILHIVYDENKVLEDHIKSTLNSLGHGILNDGK